MTSRIITAFDTLKQIGLAEPEVWRPIYLEGLREAFEGEQLDEGAELAIFAAVSLESQGYYEEAVAELEFAAARANSSPDVTTKLLSTLAAIQAIRGDMAAFDTILAGAALIPLVEDPLTRVEFEVQRALVEALFLRPNAADLVREASEQAQAAGSLRFARGLNIWAVPVLTAYGHRRRAVPWVNSLTAHAEAVKSTFRTADAAALEFCLRGAEGFTELDPAPFERARRNNMARWRAQATVLRNAVLLRDTDSAFSALATLESLAKRLNPGFADSLPALREAARLDAEDVTEDLQPPSEVTLVNLPGVLAAMEVIATRGVQEQAVIWARWAEDQLPSHVRTSIEWPVARDRAHALLLVRIGNERAGTAMMERAMRWARSAGYIVESALCELQLSELWALGPGGAPERRWAQARRSARSALRDLGVEYGHYALAATGALAWGRAAEAEPKLAPREVEVLGLLAEGLTYRQVAERLNIEWTTVQVHARRIYEKLGVSGKVMAARRATELGIIGQGQR